MGVTNFRLTYIWIVKWLRTPFWLKPPAFRSHPPLPAKGWWLGHVCVHTCTGEPSGGFALVHTVDLVALVSPGRVSQLAHRPAECPLETGPIGRVSWISPVLSMCPLRGGRTGWYRGTTSQGDTSRIGRGLPRTPHFTLEGYRSWLFDLLGVPWKRCLRKGTAAAQLISQVSRDRHVSATPRPTWKGNHSWPRGPAVCPLGASPMEGYRSWSIAQLSVP